MSFEPVTRWAVRCDGDTTRGQCTQRLAYPDTDEDDSPLTVWQPALLEHPALDPATRADLRGCGWLVLRDGRLLCPHHVTAGEYLARAAVDGLPFEHGDRP